MRSTSPVAAGSSPHTRGAQHAGAGRLAAPGIIPAYAGSTCGSTNVVRLLWDHPRIRGEHPWSKTTARRSMGSSPHTRGALFQRRLCASRPGIIPAYAGSTRASQRLSRQDWDHPRIRGEHHNAHAVARGVLGSSPHTRGARFQFRFRVHSGGIIPAYAGSTEFGASVPVSNRDHPRIRGEHSLTLPAAPVMPGSSPHTRGAPPQRS